MLFIPIYLGQNITFHLAERWQMTRRIYIFTPWIEPASHLLESHFCEWQFYANFQPNEERVKLFKIYELKRHVRLSCSNFSNYCRTAREHKVRMRYTRRLIGYLLIRQNNAGWRVRWRFGVGCIITKWIQQNRPFVWHCVAQLIN